MTRRLLIACACLTTAAALYAAAVIGLGAYLCHQHTHDQETTNAHQ